MYMYFGAIRVGFWVLGFISLSQSKERQTTCIFLSVTFAECVYFDKYFMEQINTCVYG